MDIKDEKIKLCELCFVSCDEGFVVVDDDKRKLLETIRLQLDFSANEESVICKPCAENAEKCFEFKSLCLNTENCITSFSSVKSDNTVDLIDIYLNRSENKDKSKMPEDHIVCRLCLELIKHGSQISLTCDAKDKIFLNQFFPELDLIIIRDPVICALCHISLQDYFYFMRNCLDADITMQKLCTDEDSKIESKMILQIETLKYKNEGELEIDRKFHEYDMIDQVKTKPECLLGTDGEEIFLKSEPVDDDIQPTGSGDSLPPSLSQSCTAQAIDNTYLCKPSECKTDCRCSFQKHIGAPQVLDNNRETEICEKSWIYQCKGCLFKTEYRTSFRRHMLLHKPPTHKCDFCEFKTITKYSLKNHLVSNHDTSTITKYNCERCNFKTGHKGLLNRHVMIQHNGTEFSCKICPFKTKYAYTLVRHKLVHQNDSEVTMYLCEYCAYKSKHKRNLNMHLLTHNIIQSSLHQCKICPFKTKYVTSIRRHMTSVHTKASEQQVYSCDLCEYETTCKDSHSSHLLSHRDSSDATIYRCLGCQFTTKYKTSLKRHKLVHQNGPEVMKYRCKVCEFETKHKDKLGPHMRVHQDESEVTMYPCEYCKFKTKHKFSLRKHLLIHKTIEESSKDT